MKITNVHRGMSRLAILVGTIGLLIGGFRAYKALHNLPSERFERRVFEELANSDAVQKEQSKLRAGVVNPGDMPYYTQIDGPRIRAIGWNRDYSVDFFEMQDGGIVTSFMPPSVWTYLLAVALPGLGFLIGWGTIRILWWVVSGFTSST